MEENYLDRQDDLLMIEDSGWGKKKAEQYYP